MRHVSQDEYKQALILYRKLLLNQFLKIFFVRFNIIFHFTGRTLMVGCCCRWALTSVSGTSFRWKMPAARAASAVVRSKTYSTESAKTTSNDNDVPDRLVHFTHISLPRRRLGFTMTPTKDTPPGGQSQKSWTALILYNSSWHLLRAVGEVTSQRNISPKVSESPCVTIGLKRAGSEMLLVT